ncbi:hypothetical protein POM88_046389 [Heracleum sosnowskyi]|uniref:FACT complex subunit SPT16 C-terminal domain-containing protein n=1 Tax=Heracleum sosnowskyi TaxID=360622 RepID=A0AAD8H975_9APIA|nr:hypothetical protein POM88_046389 [Heracleum sosnowskyi]
MYYNYFSQGSRDVAVNIANPRYCSGKPQHSPYFNLNFLRAALAREVAEDEEFLKGYEPSDVKSDSEPENDDSASASLAESKEDEEYESEEWSKEEKGKTWHELDKEATNAGKKRGVESDSEEERNNRKLKALARHKENLSDDTKLRGKTKARVEQGVNVERRSKFRNDPQFNIVDDDFVEDSLKAAKKGSKQRQVMLKDTKGNNVNSNASKKRTKSDFQESSDEGQNKKKKKLKKRIQDMRNKMKEQVLAAQVQNETKKDGNRKQKAAIGLKDDEEVVKKVRDYEGYIQRKFTPEVFSEMVAGLNKKQKEWVVRTGFGGLLQFQMQHYPHRLGYKIAESFDRKRCCLKLIDGDVEISPLIVSKVLGMPNGEKEIEFTSDQTEEDLEMMKPNWFSMA